MSASMVSGYAVLPSQSAFQQRLSACPAERRCIHGRDAVLEFPQPGERFEGVENFREWRRQYPAKLKFHTRRITHREDLVVVENLISYDGAPWMYMVNLLELRGDRIAHERIYIMDGWDVAEWRKPWRAEQPADPPAPAP